MIEYIDTHAHLNFSSYKDDLGDVLLIAQSKGIKRIVIPAINLETSREALFLSEKYEEIFCAVGIHPNEAMNFKKRDIAEITELAKSPKVVAIGEIGLDFHHTNTSKELQLFAIHSQLNIAFNLGLPVILHSRKALFELWAIISAWKNNLISNCRPQVDHPGVFHAFEGDLHQAKEIVKNGFFIGIGGQLTYPVSVNLRNVAINIKLDDLLLETDSPFLTPIPHRGKRNEPAFISIISESLAFLKNIPVTEIASRTTENAMKLFIMEKAH